MRVKLLLENLDLIASMPNGCQKLRQLILQLAFSGRLATPMEDDPPVSSLLEDIRVERARKNGGRGIAINEPLPPFDCEEDRGTIPKHWQWVRLGEIGRIVGGGTPKTENPEYFAKRGAPWLTPADLFGSKGKYISRGKRDLSPLGLRNSSAQVMPKGTVLFSSRAPIGYVAIAKNPLATNQGFKSCVPFLPKMSEFIYHFLKYAAKKIEEKASGTTFKEVSGKQVNLIPFPLPPLPEQLRIVAEIEKLLSLCDALQEKINQVRSKREELTEAIIAELTGLGEEIKTVTRRSGRLSGSSVSKSYKATRLGQLILW